MRLSHLLAKIRPALWPVLEDHHIKEPAQVAVGKPNATRAHSLSSTKQTGSTCRLFVTQLGFGRGPSQTTWDAAHTLVWQ